MVPRPSAPPTPRAGAHVPALDGVRGVAILLVLAAHTLAFMPAEGLATIPVALSRGGGLGVDVFFVLSGYLITGILLEARGAPRYFRAFYLRRALRIWPLYLLVLAALMAAALWAPDRWPADAVQLRAAAPWFWLHAVNWYHAITGHELFAFGTVPFWSLAVEEQFYLVWPLVVAAVAPRRLAGLGVAIFAGSAALRLAFSVAGAPPAAVNAMTITHADGLGLGAALAIVARGAPGASFPRLRAWLLRAARHAEPSRLALGYVALMAAWTLAAPAANRAPVHAVGIAVGTVWGAWIVAAVVLAPVATGGAAVTARWLAAPWLVWIGVRSYALYLLHSPTMFLTIQVLRIWCPNVTQGAAYGAGLAVTFVLAWASWRWWESPWLSLKRYAPRPTTSPAAPDAPQVAASPSPAPTA